MDLQILSLLLLIVNTTRAQNCYYPNGDQSSTDAPCGTGPGVMCCPLQWQCLSNGLCSLPDQNLLGRYTCTDRSWKSSNCPQFCTQNGSATGNEDIQECSDGTFCCNANGSLDCCSKSNTDFLDLGAGRAVASITALSAAASPGSTSPISSATTPSLSTSSTPSGTTTPSKAASASTSSSGSESSASTSETSSQSSNTRIMSTTANDASTPKDHNSSLILGLAIGIPAGVLSLMALTYLIYRRRRNRKPTSPTFSDYSKDPSMRYSYGHFPPEGRAPELDSFPVAKQEQNRRSELPCSPAISGYGSPPSYSPQRAVNADAPVELWAGYVPYRPPHTVQDERVSEGDALVSGVNGKIERAGGVQRS